MTLIGGLGETFVYEMLECFKVIWYITRLVVERRILCF